MDATSVLPPPRSASSDCDTGLHCLLLMARYHGVPADGAQLRHQFGEVNQRVSDTNLLRAATHLGFKVARLRSRWEELGSMSLPVLAKRSDGGYLVVAKAEPDKVLVQDPAGEGPSILAKADFEAIW